MKKVKTHILNRNLERETVNIGDGTLYLTLSTGAEISVELFERDGQDGEISIRSSGTGRLVVMPVAGNAILISYRK
jgi:hypothetical protein